VPWVALACGLSWIAGPARAAEPAPISAHIDWRSSVCGSATEFAQLIAGRTERVRFVPSGEQLRLAVHIEPQGTVWRASVTFLVAGKAPVLRKIESPDCGDALDALALVVAIGVDERWRAGATAARPRAPSRYPARPHPSELVNAPEPGPLLDSGEAGVVLAPSTLAVPVPHTAAAAVGTVPASSPPASPAVSVSPPPPWTWAGGVGARWLQGAAPEPLLGAELWLRGQWERGALFSPDFGLSLAHDRARGIERPEGRADFALSAAGAELCPLRFGAPRLRLQPCLTSTLGWLSVSGRRTFRAHTDSSPWWTLGAAAQVMAKLGSVALRLTGGLAHPFERNRYRFLSPACISENCEEPSFHRVERVVWSIGAGAGLSF
jgi:hypothetical protein